MFSNQGRRKPAGIAKHPFGLDKLRIDRCPALSPRER